MRLGLTSQCHDIVSDDPDADIVEIIVCKGCDVPLLFGQRVAFIAGALCVEKLPPALSRIVNGIRITRNAGLTRFDRIDNRQRRLLLERYDPAVPELGLVVEGVQNGRGVALADAAFDADRGGPAIGEGVGGIVADTACHGSVSR
jgi:hypothetical protein